MSNVSATQLGLHCGIRYDECLCSAQSAKSITLEKCLTDRFLLGHRISLLFSFIVQICFIRELFTIIVKSLWIVAVFIFIIIGKGIYRSSCFHRGLNATGENLFILVLYDTQRLRGIVHPASNNDTTVDYRDIINEYHFQISSAE